MKPFIVLAAGVLSQTAMGGIYAWSAFVPSLINNYSLSAVQCGMLFGVMVAVFSITTIPAGRILIRLGPRKTAGIGAVLFGAGYIAASFSGGSYPLLIVTLGLLTGTGIGFGYVCPIATGMEWFPNNRGLVTGTAVAGFGMGAVLLSRIAVYFLQFYDVLIVFRIIGISLGLLALAASMLMSRPDTDRQKHDSAKSSEESLPESGAVEKASSRSSLLSPAFLMLFSGMFAGTFAGLLISGNLQPMKMSFGLDYSQAAFAIILFAAGNTVGRLFWGYVHDCLKSRKTLLISQSFLLVSIILMLFPVPGIVLQFLSIAAGFGFGACFVVYASSVVEHFGLKNLARLYPVCFSSYGLAALLGPAAGGFSADYYGSFFPALAGSAVLLALAVSVTYMLFPLSAKEPKIERKIA